MHRALSGRIGPIALSLAAAGLSACSAHPNESERADEHQQAFVANSGVFVNEIHYDNEGDDANEAVEVVGPAGTDLSGWSLVLYNGNGGAVYDTEALSGVLQDQGQGFGTTVISFPLNGIQNGSPDAIALVNAASELVELLSYEGSFVAVGGPAAGMTSTDIMVSESSTTPAGFSLGRAGVGTHNVDFVWQPAAASSFGAINAGQSFGALGDAAPSVLSTYPPQGDFQVPVSAVLELHFSEPVALAADALTLVCNLLPKPATLQGGPESFLLTPDEPFQPGDQCTLTLGKDSVSDVDADDPPDGLSQDLALEFGVPRPASIAEVQGAQHRSPLEGQVVEVAGIVSVVQNNGLYLQSETPDGNVATSEGLFVFTSSAPAATVGDRVRVVGKVTEFRAGCNGCSPEDSAFYNLTLTEISTPNTLSVESSGHALSEPTLIGDGGRLPPRTIIDDDTAGSVEVPSETRFDPARDGIDFYESLESMRVLVNDAIAVSPTNSFGEIGIVGDSGQYAGKFSARGGIVVRPNDFNPERLILDDVLVSDPPLVHVGARFVQPVLGVISYSFGNFKLLNSEPLDVADATSLVRESFDAALREATDLDIATFNVENLSPSDLASKFEALANIVVNHLRSPDILTLEEVQDNSGPTNDGVVDATLTLQLLAQAIVDAGGPSYEYVEIAPENGLDGGQPGGNIRVAFLYDTSRGLSLSNRPGASATTPNQVVDASGVPQLLYSPGRIDPTNEAFENSRKPLAVEFVYRDKTLIIVANHFNSKGGDQPLFGHAQPPELTSEVQRLGQAEVVADFVRQVTSVDPEAAVVVMGDLNDFWFSPTLALLEAAGLRNPMKGLPLEERYTYVFDGNAQALDHILLSSGARRRGFLYDIVHVNAEFYDQVSDHDPSVVRLRFR